MKKTLTFAILLCFALTAQAQLRFNDRPKLVVGIVVDQMRWDYLPRYYDQFTSDGFRRLIEQGYSCDNCLINYVPTVTPSATRRPIPVPHRPSTAFAATTSS